MKLVYIMFSWIFLSCSFNGVKSIVVPNLPYLLSTKIAGQLDLYYSQEKKLKVELEALFKKSNPQIKELRSLIAGIDLKKSSPDLTRQEISELFVTLVKDFNNILARYYSHLTPKQQSHFLKELDDEDKQLKEKIKDKNLDSVIDRYEYFFGTLNEEQLSLIRNNSSIYMGLYEGRLKRRSLLQKQLNETFKITSQESRTNSIRKIYDENIITASKDPDLEKAFQIVKTILAQLDSKQRDAFYERKSDLLEWLDEFTKNFAK